MFPWKTAFKLITNHRRPLYLQLSDQFINKISQGILKSGQKLPGTRQLSQILEVNRKTVVKAYEELIGQGWLISVEASGTFITKDLPILSTHALKNRIKNANISNDFHTLNQLAYIPLTHENKRIKIGFDGGSPDQRIAPLDWIYKECKYFAKSKNGKQLLSYAEPAGLLLLRQVLSDYLGQTRGISSNEENLMITRGSQMGIYLAAQILLNQNDIAIVGNTSYDAADWTFRQRGAKLERVEVDQQGMNIDHLEKLCQNKNVRLVYVTPHHHFPTTVTLSSSRRIQLLNLSEKYNFHIIEDDYDYDFHYKRSPILPLASLDRNRRIIYIGSFSKVYAPTIRIGYLVASKYLVNELSKLRRIIDRQGDHLLQRVMADSIKNGELGRHLKKSIMAYRQRRDHLMHRLVTDFSENVTFNPPEGGMALWAKFKNVDLLKLKPTVKKRTKK